MINELSKQIHENAKAHGFFDKEKNIGEMLWWLRLDYDEENLTMSKINYWLTKLVKKGLLMKKTAKSHTQYFLTDVVVR